MGTEGRVLCEREQKMGRRRKTVFTTTHLKLGMDFPLTKRVLFGRLELGSSMVADLIVAVPLPLLAPPELQDVPVR